jgi:hypothetical protein
MKIRPMMRRLCWEVLADWWSVPGRDGGEKVVE